MVACQQTYVQNRTRVAKVASYETSQETSVSCTQLVVLYAPFQFGSEYNLLAQWSFYNIEMNRKMITTQHPGLPLIQFPFQIATIPFQRTQKQTEIAQAF